MVIKTTPRTTTIESLFTLTYGFEAMVLVEVGAGSLRRNNYDPRNNEVSLKMYLDTIEGLIADS